MITFDEACATVGYDRRGGKAPEEVKTYFAYKAGEAVEFISLGAAKAFSHNYEIVVKNKDEIKKYWDDRSALEAKAFNVWYNALIEEYVDEFFTKEMFDVCYDKAYDDGHSSGYDEVANCMIGYSEFADKIRNIAMKECA